MPRAFFEDAWPTHRRCTQCPEGVCTHPRCNAGTQRSKTIKQAFLPLCMACYNAAMQSRPNSLCVTRILARPAKTSSVVPFTHEEYRKTDFLGRKSYRINMYQQRMQTALNEAKLSESKMKHYCKEHGLEHAFYNRRAYGRHAAKIKAGEAVALGGHVYNPHDECELCLKIERHGSDMQSFINVAKRWEKCIARGGVATKGKKKTEG